MQYHIPEDSNLHNSNMIASNLKIQLVSRLLIFKNSTFYKRNWAKVSCTCAQLRIIPSRCTRKWKYSINVHNNCEITWR